MSGRGRKRPRQAEQPNFIVAFTSSSSSSKHHEQPPPRREGLYRLRGREDTYEIIFIKSQEVLKNNTHKKRRQTRMVCDYFMAQQNVQVSLNILLLLLLYSVMVLVVSLNSLQAIESMQYNNYPIFGQAGEEAHLPCLVGRLDRCGEPYLIAWYKSGNNMLTWNRLDREQEASKGVVRFKFSKKKRLKASGNCDHPALLGAKMRRDLSPLECYKLSLAQLELADEGFYKCEITFADMVDPEKCPAVTISQLSVIARPNEPEMLVNGRNWKRDESSKMSLQSLKEGGQLRLECQSSGGRPAPRIEWLNVTLSSQQVSSSELLRAQKRNSQLLEPSSGQPVTTSALTVGLTRHDVNAIFACLVLPASSHLIQSSSNHQFGVTSKLASLPLAAEHDQLIARATSYLSTLLLAHDNGQVPAPPAPLLLRWIKLDVQVKPSSSRLLVRDLLSNVTLEPVNQALSSNWDELSAYSQMPPYYSVQPNRLYAIQCHAEGARPRAQLTWFNRSVPIDIATVDLSDSPGSSDYQLQMHHSIAHHRMSSFTRTIARPDGTFSTSATLLFTSSPWDNFEELICRISTEAFLVDELAQMTPILPARLYINYEPLAWLEAEPSLVMQDTQSVSFLGAFEGNQTLRVDEGRTLSLRCFVSASPLAHNMIVQIDWLKEGRKLALQVAGNQAQKVSKEAQQANASLLLSSRRVKIEKTNHLHMPQQQQHQSSSSSSGSKLMCSSLLTIEPLSKQDSGAYSCQFKLVPAPGSPTPQANQQQQQQPQHQHTRITSGQANQTIQVNVIEGKAIAPILRISSTKRILIYGLKSTSDSDESTEPSSLVTHNHDHNYNNNKRPLHLSALLESDSQLSLKCELPNLAPYLLLGPARKILWYLNGVQLHSSSSSDTYNLSLSSLPTFASQLGSAQPGQALGSLSCAHYALASPSSTTTQQLASPDTFHANLIRIHQSRNQIELKLRVGPKLLLNHPELMPQVRSFSELELSANPASKLNLICLAQCEPICSIDWFLNERPLVSIAHENLWTRNGHYLQEQTHYTRSAEFFAGNKLGNLLFREGITNKQGNESKFAWFKASYLSSGYGSSSSPSPQSQQQQDISSNSALKWLHEAEGSLLNHGANVIAKLELTYNQIKQLLLQTDDFQDASADDQILIKCKLNPLLAGQSKASSSNGASSKRPAAQGLTFGHLLLEPLEYFPRVAQQSLSLSYSIEAAGQAGMKGQERGENDDDDAAAADRSGIQLSDQLLNLTALYGKGEDVSRGNLSDHQHIDSFAKASPAHHQPDTAQLWTGDLYSRRLMSPLDSSGSNNFIGKNFSSISSDEMQISILLDQPPRRVSISFSNLVSSDIKISDVSFSESQLLELLDPNRAEPVLECTAFSFPPAQFKWTFTDVNKSEHLLAEGQNSRKLSLRQFIEFRQRHFNLDPVAAYGVDLISGIVGNYTCTATNIHGSRRAIMPLQIQGRPLCKLSLGAEYLNLEHELMVNLRCTIYSSPVLLETVWFRNGQQLFINKSLALDSLMIRKGLKEDLNELASLANLQLVNVVELPIQVLNKQQDFMLMDLTAQMANFKCIARNSLGYSEACELSQPDKLTLMNAFKPHGGVYVTAKSPALSMISFSDSSKQQQIPSINLLTSSNTNQLDSSSQPVFALIRNLFARVDWVLVVGCLLGATWLLFLLGSSIIKRRLGPPRKTNESANKNNTSWRFSTSTRNDLHALGNENSSSSASAGLPFQSKICANYYGGSNGDSDHDMIQSCSQSSHYEDYTAAQNQQLQLQQRLLNQPAQSVTNSIYFNAQPPPPHPLPPHTSSSTLNRRNLKTPISTSSGAKYSGDSSSGGGYSSRRLIRLNEHGANTTRELILGSNSSSQPFQSSSSKNNNNNNNNNKLAATIRESLSGASSIKRYSTGLMTLKPNVPLITGINTTRINLDQQITNRQQQQYRFAIHQHQRESGRNDQTLASPIKGEHIYDDVIYNQKIL